MPKFTYPFCYVPHPLIKEAACSLIARIDSDPSLKGLFAEGKMLGALLCEEGLLYAFSGLAGGRGTVDGFVPPILDITSAGCHFKQRETEISAMPAGPDKSAASRELQAWLLENYKVMNALGEELSVQEIFALRGLTPPGGTGDCAAPRLLNYAFRHGMKPVAMGEFWYGASPRAEVRQQGCFYPSCTGKCGPLLTWMMQGLDVEDNPLDKGFSTGVQPEVMFEDESIIVVNKPAGMLSVPGRVKAESLLEWLQARYGEVHSCHRLDMDTSGVMVFARTLQIKTILESQFAGRQVSKVYRARLSAALGPWNHAMKGTIALPLLLDYYDRPRQMVDYENGKLAVTEYEVKAILPNSEVEVEFRPLTGRSHQIRVHAAHASGLGRPIKGDRLYGDASEGRLMLHAQSITFNHPVSGSRVTFDTGNLSDLDQ